MALQIWLPLKGNLDNYGLSNIDFLNTGVNIDNNGKIGQCYHFNADQYIKESTYNWTNFNTSEFSLCCWYKEPSPVASGNSQIICIGTSSGWNNIRIGLLRRTSNGYPLFSVSDGNTAIQYGFTASTFTLDTWNHIAVTYNNGELKMYLNGILNKTSSTTIIPVLNSSQHLGIGAASNGAEKLTGYLNDVRIYDHCLSAKEIEEISKGLILHYKLDNTGGKNNNIKYSTIMNRGCTSFTYDERKLEWTAICPVSTSSWGVGFYIGDTSIKWGYGETWVVSMEIYVPQSLNWNCDINNKPDLTDISSYTGNDYDITGQRKVNTNGIDNSKTLQPGWNKIWFSQTASNSTYGLYNYSTNWGIVTSSLTNPITIKIRNIKGEIFYSGEDIKPTFFTLNDNIFPNNIIYDSSGYQNNGISYGDIKINSNSARYSCCSYLSSGNTDYIVTQNPVGNPQDAITMNIWFKSSNKSPGADYHHMFNGLTSWCYIEMAVHKNGFLRCGLYINGTRYVANTNNTNLLDGNWHMLTMTYDGTNIKRYVDAELKNTQAATGNIDRPNDKFIFGHGTNTGYYCKETYLSDVRLYATALTIEQIKELYDTSATVDKNGNIYAREAIEL